jgi:hypothetical protein
MRAWPARCGDRATSKNADVRRRLPATSARSSTGGQNRVTKSALSPCASAAQREIPVNDDFRAKSNRIRTVVIVRSPSPFTLHTCARLALIAAVILALLNGSTRVQASVPASDRDPRPAIKCVNGKAERALISCHKVARFGSLIQFSLQIDVSERAVTVVRIRPPCVCIA